MLYEEVLDIFCENSVVVCLTLRGIAVIAQIDSVDGAVESAGECAVKKLASEQRSN